MATRKGSKKPPTMAEQRVTTIFDTIEALVDQSPDQFNNNDDGPLRWIAQSLHVPFLVVKLAADNYMKDDDMLDIDDVVEGMEWLRKHQVPPALLHRRPKTRQEEWESADDKKADDAKKGV